MYAKAFRFFLVFLFFLGVSIVRIFAQEPSWVPGTPSVVSTGVFSITVNYGINMTGKIYIVVMNNASGYISGSVRWLAQQPIGGIIEDNAVITIAAGDVGTIFQRTFSVATAGRSYNVWLVAESSGGVLQATPTKLLATTLPCP
ncbi:MAG TPA: hypothetical protein PLT59_12280, partial [Bacteroidales bacterium]|nr:hypothetical protein [Bacteroidales bacterium]